MKHYLIIISVFICFGEVFSVSVNTNTKETKVKEERVSLENQKDAEIRYDPTWESLDSRPLPSWYDESKIGIFIHWGVYSVPSYINAWFWYSWLTDGSQAHDDFIKKNYPPGFAYQVHPIVVIEDVQDSTSFIHA